MSLSTLLGDINILVTTDVHSWLDGHVHLDHPYGQPARTDATFGDIVSLLEHVRSAAAAHRRDV
jgi:2',3'-cyclic-nucleotide 2'-phosphodiesterase (5'-nucleotidase family)